MKQDTEPADYFTAVFLFDQIDYLQAAIKPESLVEIIPDLGGPPNHDANVFFYQSNVINKVTGDPIRIQAPEITIDESAGIEKKKAASPLS